MSKSAILESITKPQLREGLPEVSPGDTVKVSVRVREGGKERLQAFEGVVLANKHGGIRQSITVRKISHGVGVERTFLIHSPMVAKIEVLRRGKVRRAKLYYLRGKVGKEARIDEAR